RFLQADDEKRFRVLGFVHGPYFDEALDLFELRAAATGLDPQLVRYWRELLQQRGGRRAAAPGDEDEARAGEEVADAGDSDGDAGLGRGEAPPAAAGAAPDEESGEGPDRVDQPLDDQRPAGERIGDGDDGGGRRRRRRRRRGRRGRGRGGEPGMAGAAPA